MLPGRARLAAACAVSRKMLPLRAASIRRPLSRSPLCGIGTCQHKMQAAGRTGKSNPTAHLHPVLPCCPATTPPPPPHALTSGHAPHGEWVYLGVDGPGHRAQPRAESRQVCHQAGKDEPGVAAAQQPGGHNRGPHSAQVSERPRRRHIRAGLRGGKAAGSQACRRHPAWVRVLPGTAVVNSCHCCLPSHLGQP